MKQTEIGLIPDDWEVKEFNQVATLINGRAYSQSELLKQGKYKVLRVGNFGTNDTWYYSNLELPEKQYCNKGDLLYCWSCTYGAYIWNEDDTIYHYHIWKIQTNNADKYYLKYILNNDIASQMSNSNGSTMAHITKGFLEKRRFVFPPFEEQQRIAKALSDVDALITTTEKLIQKKKNIKQGIMQELLTGKKRLPGFAPVVVEPVETTGYKQTELGLIPEDWEVKSLGDIFSIKHGYGFEGQFFSSENNQHIVVTPGNFKLEGGFQKQKQPIYYTGTYPDEFKLKPNNLIIMMTDLSKNSNTLGNPAIVPDDGNYYLHNQRIGLIQIHNDSFVKDYLYLLLCTKEYHESVVATAAGSTVKHTSPNRIYSINLVVSTSKEEQTAIANVLSSMDKEIESLNTKLEKYRNLKTAMMQQLLTGKIRLV